jgi:hypothetical protein
MLIMYLQSYSHRLVTQCFCVLLLACLSVSQAHAAVPLIISELEVVAVAGQPFCYEIQAQHEPLGYSVLNIPYWLQRDAAKLSGTPKVPGNWTIQLLALNADGVSQPVELSIQVLKPTATPAATPTRPLDTISIPNGDA